MGASIRVAFASIAACVFLLSAYAAGQVPKAAQPKPPVEAPQKTAVKKAQPIERAAAKPAVEVKVQQKVVVRGMGVMPEANRKALEQQFTQQLRPVLRSELLVLRSICHLTANQRKALSRESEQILKAAVDAYVATQQKMMQGIGTQYPDVPKMMREGLEKAIRVHVGREAATAYVIEIESRANERKDTNVQFLVSKLDDSLVLSADQRDKIFDSLRSHWNDNWTQNVEYLQQNDQFFPMLPDQYITPFLDLNQRRVWAGIPKNNFNFGFNIGFVAGLQGEADDPLADPDEPSETTPELPDDVFQKASGEEKRNPQIRERPTRLFNGPARIEP